MMKKLYTILCLVIFANLSISSQSQISINAKVIDSETKKGVPYVSISLKKRGDIKTITNLYGHFSLKDILANDTIVLSSIGYETFTEVAYKLSSDSIINLEPQTIILDEIVVTNLSVRDILKKVNENRKQNYPSTYPILDGVYRKQMLVDNDYIFLGDGDLAIAFFNSKRKPNLYLNNIEIFKHKNALNYYFTIPAYHILVADPYQNYIHDSEYLEKRTWELSHIFSKTSKEYNIIKLSFSRKKEFLKENEVSYNEYIYIKTPEYAIIKVERDICYWFKKNGKITSEKVFTKNVHEYKETNNKFLLSYSRFELSMNSNDRFHQYIIDFFSSLNYYGKIKSNFKLDEDPFEKYYNVKTITKEKPNSQRIIPDYEHK